VPLEITDCDFKSSNSSWVSSKARYLGNVLIAFEGLVEDSRLDLEHGCKVSVQDHTHALISTIVKRSELTATATSWPLKATGLTHG